MQNRISDGSRALTGVVLDDGGEPVSVRISLPHIVLGEAIGDHHDDIALTNVQYVFLIIAAAWFRADDLVQKLAANRQYVALLPSRRIVNRVRVTRVRQ